MIPSNNGFPIAEEFSGLHNHFLDFPEVSLLKIGFLASYSNNLLAIRLKILLPISKMSTTSANAVAPAPSKVVILRGPPGAGKSTVSCALLAKLRAENGPNRKVAYIEQDYFRKGILGCPGKMCQQLPFLVNKKYDFLYLAIQKNYQ